MQVFKFIHLTESKYKKIIITWNFYSWLKNIRDMPWNIYWQNYEGYCSFFPHNYNTIVVSHQEVLFCVYELQFCVEDQRPLVLKEPITSTPETNITLHANYIPLSNRKKGSITPYYMNKKNIKIKTDQELNLFTNSQVKSISFSWLSSNSWCLTQHYKAVLWTLPTLDAQNNPFVQAVFITSSNSSVT